MGSLTAALMSHPSHHGEALSNQALEKFVWGRGHRCDGLSHSNKNRPRDGHPLNHLEPGDDEDIQTGRGDGHGLDGEIGDMVEEDVGRAARAEAEMGKWPYGRLNP